jgi:ribosome-binding factor A
MNGGVVMSQLRVEKVQEFIKQEISKIIVSELKDPRIGFVTVTNVTVTRDLSHATLYVSLYGSDDQKEATWQGLQSSLGFMRTEIAKRIRLRVAPDLTLHLDESLNYSAHIQELLLKIKEEEKK